MKYLIKESQLDQVIINYLDELFQVDDVNFHYPLEYDEETGEEYEDEGCEYFTQGSHARTICPTVDVETKYSNVLNGYFGDRWEEPFKIWFERNFENPVKTVEWWGKGD